MNDFVQQFSQESEEVNVPKAVKDLYREHAVSRQQLIQKNIGILQQSLVAFQYIQQMEDQLSKIKEDRKTEPETLLSHEDHTSLGDQLSKLKTQEFSLQTKISSLTIELNQKTSESETLKSQLMNKEAEYKPQIAHLKLEISRRSQQVAEFKNKFLESQQERVKLQLKVKELEEREVSNRSMNLNLSRNESSRGITSNEITRKIRFDTDFFSNKLFGNKLKSSVIEEAKDVLDAPIPRKTFVDHNTLMSALQVQSQASLTLDRKAFLTVK